MSKSRLRARAWTRPVSAGIPLFLALLPAACGGGGTTSGTTASSTGDTASSSSTGGAGGAGETSSAVTTSSSSSASSSGGATGSGGQGGSGGSGVCAPGSTHACYEGPGGTLGVGVCKGGIQTCNTMGTALGPCVGQVLPSPETCATPGDDDCNGQVNESGDGCSCAPGSATACYTGPAGTLGVGLCKGGTRHCNALGTSYGPCEGEVIPQAETCATPDDDDCNGQVNEGGAGCVCAPNATASCYTGPAGNAGVGICKAGSQVCDAQGTSLSACVGSVLPQTEICGDALDNNCDGQVNEGCLCAPGSTATCYSGPAGTQGVGPCKSGTQTCNATGNGYGACMGEVKPQPETCSTPIDDDCNGQVNEGGVGCVCAPGATVSCYTGPAGLGGVGICTLGSQKCDAQGTSATACVGSVLPKIENCATAADEDCDGVAAPCSGSNIWSRAWGGPIDDEGNSLSVDASDNIFFGGYVTGPVNMGCGPVAVASGVDAAALAKLTPGGACIWSKAFGQNAQMLSVAADPSGNVLTTGMYGVSVDLGAGPVASLGGNDGFVAKFDSLGNLLWSKYFGDAAAQTPDTVATDAAGDLIAYGYFNGTVDFGGGPLTSAGGSDLYVAKFSPTGTLIWAKRFGDAANQLARGLAVDPAGNVLITGTFNGSVNFGGATLMSAGFGDVFLAKLDVAGNHVWSKRFGDSADQLGAGVATNAAGEVYITGSFISTISFGGAGLSSLGGADGYIAKFSPAGAYLWSLRQGGPAGQASVGASVDPLGNVAITAVMAGSASFGGATLTAAGSSDLVVAKYDPTGKHLWSKIFGDAALQGAKAITTDSKGNVLVSGLENGPIDFGGGPVYSQAGEDTYLAKLSP